MLIKKGKSYADLPKDAEVIAASIVASTLLNPFVLALQFVSMAELKLIRHMNRDAVGYPLFMAQSHGKLEFVPPTHREVELRIVYQIPPIEI